MRKNLTQNLILLVSILPISQYFVTVEVVYNMSSNVGKPEAENIYTSHDNRSKHVTVSADHDTGGNIEQDTSPTSVEVHPIQNLNKS
jgi:hypothetical protein